MDRFQSQTPHVVEQAPVQQEFDGRRARIVQVRICHPINARKGVINRYFKQNGFEYEDSKMTLVDWRWAAQKGLWDKDRKRWNEAAGGRAEYLRQRNFLVRHRKLGHSRKVISAQ